MWTPPTGGSHPLARRVIVLDDTLCFLTKCLENDRREDPLPAEGPQAGQGRGFTGAGGGGGDRDLQYLQDEQQEQGEQDLQQSQVIKVSVHTATTVTDQRQLQHTVHTGRCR